MHCPICTKTRRRSFWRNGVCESCDPYQAMPPLPPPEEPIYPLAAVIGAAALYHDEHVWITEAEARDRGTPSSAAEILESIEQQTIRADWKTLTHPEAYAWALSLLSKPEDECTDYECALCLLFRTGWVTKESFALAAGVYHAYTRAVPARPEEQPPGPVTGVYAGTVGERMDLPECQCTAVHSLGVGGEHPEWGERFLIKFTTREGAECVWWAGTGGKFDPRPGQAYNIRASIKAHEPFNGRACTTLSRPAEYNPADGKLLHPPKRKAKE